MKFFLRLFLLVSSIFLLTVCSNQRFPDCCESDGFRDTPFKVTNIYGFKTGIKDVFLKNTDTRGYLFIISAADLMTLLNAANSRVFEDTGVISATILSSGNPVKEIKILPVDANGRRLESEMSSIASGAASTPIFVRNLFYNNLGRVPDFLLPGTNEGGGFTIFNVEAGEVFMWVSEGGRGNGHFTVFNDEVSIGFLDVIPVLRSDIEIFGRVREKKASNSEADLPAASSVIFLGYHDNFEFHTNTSKVFEQGINGNDEIVNASVPANGKVIAKAYYVSPSGTKTYKDTYQTIFISLDLVKSLTAFQKITTNVFSFSDTFITTKAAQAGIAIDTSKGIIFGTAQISGSDTVTAAQGATRIILTDKTGAEVGQPVYLDSDFNPVPGNTGTDANGNFIIYNVEPGEVLLRAVSKVSSVQCSGESEYLTGGKETFAVADSITIEDAQMIFVSAAGCDTEPPFLTADVDGRTWDLDNQPVSGVNIEFTSLTGVSAVSDSEGRFNISKAAGQEDTSPVLSNTSYIVRLHSDDSAYADTYNTFTTGVKSSVADLFIINKNDLKVNGVIPGFPVIKGRLESIDDGLSAENVSISAIDMNGNKVGNVYYYDENRNISTSLTSTSGNGEFVITGLPSGSGVLDKKINIDVVSGDDAGSRVITIYDNNSVTLTTVQVNKVYPREVTAQGTIKDLHGNAVSGADVTIIGKPKVIDNPKVEDDGNNFAEPELDSFSSGSAGEFSKALPANTKLVLKTENPACMDTYMYDLKAGLFDFETEILCATNSEISSYLSETGISSSLNTGIVAGKIMFSNLGLVSSASIGKEPSKILSGFFNQDKYKDIVVISADDNSVSFYMGSGDGSFTLNSAGSQTLPETPGDIIFADMDGDQITDIVISGRGTGNIMILAGRGRGLFYEEPVIVNSNGIISSIGAGDFDGDGYNDIVTTDSSSNGSEGLLFLRNNKNETFAEPVGFLTAAAPSGLVITDMNLDNTLDIVVLSPLPEEAVKVLIGDGDGGFHEGDEDINFVTKLYYPVDSVPVKVAAADLNADAVPEVITLQQDQKKMSILKGQVSNIQILDFPETTAYDIPGTPVSLAIMDMDGDLRPDIVVSTIEPSGVSVFFGNGDGTVNSNTIQKDAGTSAGDVVILDVNNDSQNDVVVADKAGDALNVFLGIDSPLSGVQVGISNELGESTGNIFYFGSDSFTIDPSLTQTSSNGRFIVFNVPQGFVMIASETVGNGNKNLTSTAGALTYAEMKVSPLPPDTVDIEGLTLDPVGPSPGGTGINEVGVNILGTGRTVTSGDFENRKGRYILEDINASSDYWIRLSHNSGFR